MAITQSLLHVQADPQENRDVLFITPCLSFAPNSVSIINSALTERACSPKANLVCVESMSC